MRNAALQNKPLAITAGLLLLAGTRTAHAQLSTTISTVTKPATSVGTAHLVEWDLSTLPDAVDGNPGGIVVDNRGRDDNRAWFVTRVAAPDSTAGGQRVYRFDPSRSLTKGDARWTSWDLQVDTFAGGLTHIRPSYDRRYLFARTATFVQRIDTYSCDSSYPSTCQRTVWTFEETPIEPTFVSDVAVDDQNRVFTTGVSSQFPDGYVQMLIPGSTTVTRWRPGTAPGACVSQGATFSCLSGIDLHPYKQYLVYYTEPNTDTIAELNINVANPSTYSPNIRRWSLAKLSAAVGETITQPRTLHFDNRGRLWVNTGSGHLVSLDPQTNKMTKHQIPGANTNDPWGLGPDDDVVGYTGATTNKVAVLFPKVKAVVVNPDPGVAPFEPFPTVALNQATKRLSGTVPAVAKIVDATTTRKDDGTYVEAVINSNGNDSLQPLGITPNHGKSQGTFFYTVGLTGSGAIDPFTEQPANLAIAKRIGFARLPVKEKIKNPRDDDDTDDGFDRTRDPRWHNSEVGDDDADGVEDKYDTPSNKENTSRADMAPITAINTASFSMTTTATSLAMIAAVEPDDLTATMAVDVYNAIGTLVGTSGPMIGVAAVTIPSPGAGTFTVKVRNLSGRTVNFTPTFVVREPVSVVP